MRSVSFLKQIKNSWLLIVFGLVALILWNTNLLFDRLKTEERKKWNSGPWHKKSPFRI